MQKQDGDPLVLDALSLNANHEWLLRNKVVHGKIVFLRRLNNYIC